MFKNLPSLFLSVLIHGALLALVIVGSDWELESQQQVLQKPVEIVKAVVIDDGQLQAEMAKLQEKIKRKQLEEEERLAELERQALMEEEKRQAEEKRLIELEREQQEELRRQAEQKIKQEEEKKRLAEVKRKQEAEKKRLEALEAKKAAEKKRLAELEKKKKAEEKRLAELEVKRKKEAEAKRKAAEEAKAKRDAELQRQRAVEQRRLQSLRNEYTAMIKQHVERYWRRPPSAVPGLSCTVKVKQIPGGEVISARVDVCNGDLVVHRSIEAAVLRASPLPVPPDPALFDRNLVFNFAPRD